MKTPHLLDLPFTSRFPSTVLCHPAPSRSALPRSAPCHPALPRSARATRHSVRCSPLVGGLLVCATALSTTACTKPPTDNPGATLGQGTLGVSPDGTRAASVYS